MLESVTDFQQALGMVWIVGRVAYKCQPDPYHCVTQGVDSVLLPLIIALLGAHQL